MQEQRRGFSSVSAERFKMDQQPYLDLGHLANPDWMTLIEVTSQLHEAGLADITVQAIPSVDSEDTHSLRWSPDAKSEQVTHPLGTLFTAVYIARAASFNVVDRGDPLLYNLLIRREVEDQLAAFKQNPPLFTAFTRAVDEQKRFTFWNEGDGAYSAIREIADLTKAIVPEEQAEDGEKIEQSKEGHAFQKYPALAIFLHETHVDYTIVPEIILRSDSDIAHELYIESMQKRLSDLIRPHRSSDAIETAKGAYLDPLVKINQDGSGLENSVVKQYLSEIYQKFFNPYDGEFEGRLPEDFEFRRFVFESKRDILQLFFDSFDNEYLQFTRKYFQQRGQTAEARLILFGFLENISANNVPGKTKLLKDYIEECFSDFPLAADSLGRFLEEKTAYPDSEHHIGNAVLQRVMLSLHEEKTIGEISGRHEVMVPNRLYNYFIAACLERYQHVEGDENARRFLNRMDKSDFPEGVRKIARFKRDNPTRLTDPS